MTTNAMVVRRKTFSPLSEVRAKSLRNDKPLDITSELSRVVTSALSDSTFIFSLAVTLFVILTHLDDVDSGPLGEFLHTHSSNVLCRWVLNNIDKAFGIISFLPACLRAPKSLRTTMFVSAIVCILMLPPLHIYIYSVASLATALFVNLRLPQHKFAALVIAGYFVYNDIKNKISAQNNPEGFPSPLPQTAT